MHVRFRGKNGHAFYVAKCPARQSTRVGQRSILSPQRAPRRQRLLSIEHAIVAAGVDQLVLRQVAHASRWWQRTGCFHHVEAHEPYAEDQRRNAEEHRFHFY